MRDGEKVTLTVRRPNQDITVVLQAHDDEWFVIYSVDEVGYQAQLTGLERANVKARAHRGEDETGL